MLWMVILAAYLGVFRRAAPLFSLWLGVLLLVRLTFGTTRGFLVAICFSAAFAAIVGYSTSVFWGTVFGGMYFGTFAYLVVSFVVWIVDKIDALLQTKSPKDQKR